MIRLHPTADIECFIKQKFDADTIKNETMIFRGDWDFALEHGNICTQTVLKAISDHHQFRSDWDFNSALGNVAIIDTKVTMLKPGMYPCIGGWHCDEVPRSVKNGQPIISKIGDDAQHWLVSLATDPKLCPTAFISEQVDLLDGVIDPDAVWKSLHKHIESSHYSKQFAYPGEVVRHSRSDIHAGTMAEMEGWRFFFKLWFAKPKGINNEIRRQVQVYTDISGGW